MKNLNFLKLFMATMIMAISTVLTGCVDDNDTEAPYLTVTPTSLSFDSEGVATEDSQDFVEISTNRQWTATSNKTWLTLSQAEGEGDAKLYFSVPAGTNDEATVTIQISNKIGALAQEYVTIKAGGAAQFESEVVFNTTVGTTSVSSPYPYVDKYEGWDSNGTGASTVTYSGYNATVRASGTSNSGSYDGASGPNIIFFGQSNPYFVINNITMPASKDFKLTFGAQYALSTTRATYDNSFHKDNFSVALSADGNTWTTIDYTVNDGDQATPYWVFATSNFSLENEVSALYIKFSATVASAFRLDDITLTTTSEAGTSVNLAGGSTDTPSTGSGKTTTIPDLITLIKAAGSTQTVIDASNDLTFEAIVQNDTVGGNYSYNNLTLATPDATTAGNGLTLYGSQVEPTTIKVNKGDRVKITLKAGTAKVVLYNGLYEVTGTKTDNWAEVEKISTGNTITPVAITADKLADYQGMTVTIVNATPSAAGTWATADATSSHTFSAAGTDFTVFCKKAATAFVGQSYKVTTGSISGIAMVNSNKAQLVPRDMDDVKAFNGEGTTGGGSTDTPSTGSSTPTISLDLTASTTYPDGFPTAKTVDATTYKIGGYEFTLAGSSDAGFYYSTTGYLMLGKTGAYMEFPAISGKKLVKAVFTSREGASGNVTLTISEADGTIPTGGESQKWAQTSPYEYTYTLSGTKADTKYRLNVTNKYNAQITKLELYYE